MPSPSSSKTPAVKEIDMRCKLFFGALPAKTNEDQLFEIASKYGKVVDSKILNRTGKKVCGFVVYSSPKEASACIAKCGDGKEEFNVEYAKAPTRTPKTSKNKVKKHKKAKCERSVHRMVSPNQSSPNQVSPSQVSPQMASPLVDLRASEFASPQVNTPFSPPIVLRPDTPLYVRDQFGNFFPVVQMPQQPPQFQQPGPFSPAGHNPMLFQQQQQQFMQPVSPDPEHLL